MRNVIKRSLNSNSHASPDEEFLARKKREKKKKKTGRTERESARENITLVYKNEQFTRNYKQKKKAEEHEKKKGIYRILSFSSTKPLQRSVRMFQID